MHRPRYEIRKQRLLGGKGKRSRYLYTYEPYVGKGKPIPARLTDYEYHGLTAVTRMAVGIASALHIRKPASKMVSWNAATRIMPARVTWSTIATAIHDALRAMLGQMFPELRPWEYPGQLAA